MVAKIVIGKSIRGVLYYNENKVTEGAAQILLASGFAGEVGKMTFQNKVKRFENLTMLKPSVKTNALHITLNFDAAEKIDNEKMQQIAIAYMERIGFGEQPFLAYRHNDAAHQHVHIATTNIQRNGIPINLHGIGWRLSEPARKAIENEFKLTVAQSKKYKPGPAIRPIDLQKVKYGRLPTKRAISNVVGALIDTYKFTSLAEFNALLREFNLTADPGKDDTEMFRKKGLIYSLVDEKGNKIGVPIKASAFYSKPTLYNLEKQFEKGIEKRTPFQSSLAKRIDEVFNKYDSITRNTLINELQNNGVSTLFRKNDKGFVYGVTFIDHHNKTVFNGRDLGKAYSAKAITERLGTIDKPKQYLSGVASKGNILPVNEPQTKTYLQPVAQTHYLENLLNPPTAEQTLPNTRRRRKRKKPPLNSKTL